jgi:hypothetical protein
VLAAAVRLSLETSEGQKWEGQVVIDLAELGLQATTKFVDANGGKTLYDYELRPGRMHRAQQFKNGGYWWWTETV